MKLPPLPMPPPLVIDLDDKKFSQSVYELELSVRSMNCIDNARIRTVLDLVQQDDKDLVRRKLFGPKSIREIRELLQDMGLNFGMKLTSSSAHRSIEGCRKAGIVCTTVGRGLCSLCKDAPLKGVK
jgi:hypothetical protein